MVWLAPGKVRCCPLNTRSRTALNSSLYFLTRRSRRSSSCQTHSRKRSLIFCCFSRAPSVELALTTCLSFLPRSEEHTSELQSLRHLVCRLLLEKKKYT